MSIRTWELGLGENEVGSLSACQFEPLLCIGRFDNLQIASLEVVLENASQVGVRFNEKNAKVRHELS
jgi:hypothetical protein